MDTLATDAWKVPTKIGGRVDTMRGRVFALKEMRTNEPTGPDLNRRVERFLRADGTLNSELSAAAAQPQAPLQAPQASRPAPRRPFSATRSGGAPATGGAPGSARLSRPQSAQAALRSSSDRIDAVNRHVYSARMQMHQ